MSHVGVRVRYLPYMVNNNLQGEGIVQKLQMKNVKSSASVRFSHHQPLPLVSLIGLT